jgi:cytochrome c oxidase subunit II
VRGTAVALSVAASILTSCQFEAPAHRQVPDALRPRGTGAGIVLAEMGWHLVFGTAVFVGVMGLLLAIVWRQRRASQVGEPDDVDIAGGEARGVRWIWLGGIVMPLLVLSVIFGRSMVSLAALQAPEGAETVTIEVTGHRWWWEVRYPAQDIVTANQVHIPAGEPVHIELHSQDVIHTFWVPQLHPKIDMLPGEVNEVWMEADRPGIYRGICAEFCGLQHARMQFQVVAMEPEDYRQWVEDRQRPPPEPTAELEVQGREVFMDNNCAQCHAITGTPAVGKMGPDLSDLAARLTLAGGVYRNNPGNLGGWLVDPQAMKPGALMPATPLDGEELQALLAYLGTLE